jgi:serine protease inhibitor
MIKSYFSIFLFFIFLIKSNSLIFQDNVIRKINEKDENILFSPLTTYQAMNFLANGGTYKTAKKELYQTLYPDKEIDDDNVDALFNKINSKCYGNSFNCRIRKKRRF